MLLFDEQPIVFDRTLAREIGDRHATVLQQVHYWIEVNRKKKNKEVYKDGYYWTYRSIKKWHEEEFDYLSFSTVRRTFDDLIEDGYLITGEYNKFGADRTKWYRVNKDKISKLYEKITNEKHLSNMTNANAQNEQMEMSKMSSSEMLKMSQPIQENNKRLNKENISSHQSNNNIIYVNQNEKVNELNDSKNINDKSFRKYNTQYFRDSFGYSRVSKNKQVELDKWIKYAVDICLMLPDAKLYVGKMRVTAGEVAQRLSELRHEHIDYIFTRLSQVSYPTNHKNYMLAVLYNAKEQYESSKSTFTGGNNAQGRYVAPMPDYLQQRVNNRGRETKERIVTEEDEAAYNALMQELHGKERSDV
ncbi:hypothetical protein PNO24_01180 [Gemella haemolysans]|uniref:hypothetical protein n=1 Tax=Gemella haemolysans TaxID=1379 RepID=UPI00232EC139|nr:hypothetical protein [Gemella haemolysans]MDB6212541.1 hypothetical protein [Gemella haemolysans]